MSALQNDVRRRLRLRLKAAGFTDQKIGDALGIDRTQVGRLLKDSATGLTLERVEILATLLGQTPLELLTPEDDTIQSLTAIELDILTRVREMTKEQRVALLMVLNWPGGKPVALPHGPSPSGVTPAALEVAQRWQAATRVGRKLILDILGFGEETKLESVRTPDVPEPADENPAATQTSPHQR
jgi:transcriptional regulator with XRE-family HTH domain